MGGGSLLVGLNQESSKGDFPYNNYAAIREESISSNQIASLEIQLKGIQAKSQILIRII